MFLIGAVKRKISELLVSIICRKNKIHKNLYYFIHKKKGGGIIGKGCEISEDVFFGSEPYLIRIGNVVAGIPARIIETTEQYYQKKKDKVLPTNNLSRAEKREYLEKIYDSF